MIGVYMVPNGYPKNPESYYDIYIDETIKNWKILIHEPFDSDYDNLEKIFKKSLSKYI